MRQEHLDSGFLIGAHSTAGSKFKLLLFEQGAEGQWELLMQARASGTCRVRCLQWVAVLAMCLERERG